MPIPNFETLDIQGFYTLNTYEQIETILQSHAEGSSLRGLSRIGKRAYGTVVSLVSAASQKSQLVHNEEVKEGDCDEIVSDEMWPFIKKTKKLWSRRIRGGGLLDWSESG